MKRLEQFAKQLNPEKVKRFTAPGFEILSAHFESIDHQVNFHAMESVTNIGSGFRHFLHKYCNMV